jgi:hypothetical protein
MAELRTDRTDRIDPRGPDTDAGPLARRPSTPELIDSERSRAGHKDHIGHVDTADWRDQHLVPHADEEPPAAAAYGLAGHDTSEPVPEADLLEQHRALDPTPIDPEPTPPGREHPAGSVDEADWWEQQIPVPSVDDDYPHDPIETQGP